MNTDYIRSLLIMFNNRNIYEIKTALTIYEYMNKDVKDVCNEEIVKVYDLILSQKEMYDPYIEEGITKIVEGHNTKYKSNDNIDEKDYVDLEK